jgi:hypothetical protein
MYSDILKLVDAINEVPLRIIDSFKEIDLSNIDITRFHTWTEYEMYLGIYRGNKPSFSNELDAFLKLWLAQLIELEEWHDDYKTQIDFAENVFNNWFLKDAENFVLKLWDCQSAHKFANEAIKDKTCLVIDDKKVYENRYGCVEQGGPGIYKMNSHMIDETKFCMAIDDIIKAVEIKYDDSWAGYRTLFLETTEEFILFCE